MPLLWMLVTSGVPHIGNVASRTSSNAPCLDRNFHYFVRDFLLLEHDDGALCLWILISFGSLKESEISTGVRISIVVVLLVRYL